MRPSYPFKTDVKSARFSLLNLYSIHQSQCSKFYFVLFFFCHLRSQRSVLFWQLWLSDFICVHPASYEQSVISGPQRQVHLLHVCAQC